ncbi:2-oxo acid dehydrogenase subunit E2 [Glaciibacter flavus]|uniref:Dihydrolipoamide acetyltransferase component of pyruvate dehydrogenase complex n=1 Tax=Orlajensenia flava TaxID=2565934 RepID=A0A4S4G0A2_9MICO|nr:dihydrolipoamide acetyltransferase family protein [Glaciibacter flavus]THG35506.1 2-oxo acid dehydrogenase subunit E2 [Glaciibacter flavus]
MTVDFLLPDLGEGLTESEIVSWHVGVGDDVTLNQIIAEVETAKAIVELPSPYTGTVARLYAEPGVVVNVGEPIVAFDVAGEGDSGPSEDAPAVAESAGGPGDAGETTPAPATGSTEPPVPATGSTEPPTSVDPAASVDPATSLDAATSVDPASAVEPAPADDLVPALPEPTQPNLVGYGATADAAVPKRRSRRTDLPEPEPERADTPTDADRPTSAADVRETRSPIRSVRKHTAAAMVQSAFTAPHVTEFLTVDVTESMAFIARLKDDRALSEHRIGILALTAKAVCLALGRHPSLNSHWDEEAQEIVQFHFVNLGIAAATPRGLVVPNIPDAERMRLPHLADAIRDLAETARAGRSAPERLGGGTISITNIGVFGIDAGTPILNPGEAAILAMGAVRREPREHLGGIALRDVMTLSLSFDHRLIDGEQGSRFLADVGSMLRDPALAMLA